MMMNAQVMKRSDVFEMKVLRAIFGLSRADRIRNERMCGWRREIVDREEEDVLR